MFTQLYERTRDRYTSLFAGTSERRCKHYLMFCEIIALHLLGARAYTLKLLCTERERDGSYLIRDCITDATLNEVRFNISSNCLFYIYAWREIDLTDTSNTLHFLNQGFLTYSLVVSYSEYSHTLIGIYP